jgi:hypothetical protein
MSIKIKWFTPESEDGERTLKQHAYISHIKKVKYTDEKYEGNKAICNRSFISDDGEKAIAFNNIETENFNPSKACKRCLQIIGMDTINYESKVKDQSTTQQ